MCLVKARVDALIAIKQAAGRTRDRQDVDILCRIRDRERR
jgi:hypothetical protein